VIALKHRIGRRAVTTLLRGHSTPAGHIVLFLTPNGGSSLHRPKRVKRGQPWRH